MFNDFFSTAVKSSNLNCDSQYLENVSEELDPIERAIEKFKNHLSIKTIKETVPLNSDFTSDFESVNSERIAKLISELDPKKSDTFKGIPINVLKGSSDLCSSFLSEVWNGEIIHLKQFPNKLKLADVTPVLKKDDLTSVENYRPNHFLHGHLFTFVDTERALVIKQHFRHLLKNRKQYLTERDLVQLFLWIYLKHLTQLIMNCC